MPHGSDGDVSDMLNEARAHGFCAHDMLPVFSDYYLTKGERLNDWTLRREMDTGTVSAIASLQTWSVRIYCTSVTSFRHFNRRKSICKRPAQCMYNH
jgi:hypothetical protein